MGHLIRLLPADLRQITHDVLEAYLSQRIDEDAAKTTVKKEFRALTSVLRFAARNGKYAGDPRNVVPELEDDYRPRTRFLTLPEADKLLRALPVDRAAQAAFILATGARWSEAEKARPMDVQGDVVRLRGTKTEGAKREVPIVTPWQVQLLATAVGYMPFRPWANSRRDLAETCKAVGIQPVSANDLRRTFATWMRHIGVDIGVIAKLLGHTSTRMAERVYARLTTESVADAIRKTGGTIVGQATDVLPAKHEILTFTGGDQKR
jgi:integrase